MKARLVFVAVLVLVVAACGGEPDAASDDGSGDSDGSSTTTSVATSSTTSTTTTTTTVEASSDSFCQFASENNDTLGPTFSPTQTPDQLRDRLLDTRDRISQAVELAPNEIKDDVRVFETAYNGLIEVFEEIEWDFANAPDDLDQDPRVLALESPDLEAAEQRIEDFCGFDFIPDQPSGGTGGTGGAGLPDDFPSDLVVEGGEVVAVVNIGGTDSVTYDVSLDTDEVIAYYTDLLGDPTSSLETPRGALWVTTWEGAALNVSVVEVTPGSTQVNVTLG